MDDKVLKSDWTRDRIAFRNLHGDVMITFKANGDFLLIEVAGRRNGPIIIDRSEATNLYCFIGQHYG